MIKITESGIQKALEETKGFEKLASVFTDMLSDNYELALTLIEMSMVMGAKLEVIATGCFIYRAIKLSEAEKEIKELEEMFQEGGE